jgi:hypothetical protein
MCAAGGETVALEGDHFTVFQSEDLAKMAEKIAATLAGPCVAGAAASPHFS